MNEISGLSSFILTVINNLSMNQSVRMGLWLHDAVSMCSYSTSSSSLSLTVHILNSSLLGDFPKSPRPTIFQVVLAGYRLKFSTSKNHVSDQLHRLPCCLCVRILLEGDNISAWRHAETRHKRWPPRHLFLAVSGRGNVAPQQWLLTTSRCRHNGQEMRI